MYCSLLIEKVVLVATLARFLLLQSSYKSLVFFELRQMFMFLLCLFSVSFSLSLSLSLSLSKHAYNR